MCVDRITVRDHFTSRYLRGSLQMKAKFLFPFRPKHAIQQRLETGSSAMYTYSSMFMENQVYDQRLLYLSFARRPSDWIKITKTALFTATLYAFSSLLACLLLFAFSPFQGDLIRFFCALTKFEMQRAPSLRKPRSDVRLSARHLGTRFLWKDTKIRFKTVVGMHRNHLATCSLCLKVSTQNQFLQINLWFGGCCCCYCPTVV